MNPQELKTLELAIHKLGFVSGALEDANDVMHHFLNKTIPLSPTRELSKLSKNGADALSGSRKAIHEIIESLQNITRTSN